MNELEPLRDFTSWNNLAANMAYVAWAAGVLVALGYFIKLSMTSSNKEKYDFINRHEIRLLWVASIIIIVGAGFFATAIWMPFRWSPLK
jgi:hypothetical protein